jgi:hypothetical protein
VKSGYTDFEPLISDRRMQEIGHKIVDEFRPKGLSDDVDFVTFIQPATTIERNGIQVPIPEVAVFAVITDNPKSAGRRVMTQAAAWLADWLARDAARLHFVSGGQDPAFPVFRRIVREHVEKIQSLREMN